MSMMNALKTDTSIEEDTDSVGGGFGVLESGLYHSRVKLAYLNIAKSGAIGLNLVLQTATGSELRQSVWMTSGDAKGKKNYYEKDGKKHYLPGFLVANSLALLTVGKEIGDLETEEKVVNLYDFDAGKELPTKVQMFMDLVNQEVIAGVIKQTVDKNVKNDAGAYVPSGETRDENELDKLFRLKDGMTVNEIKARAESPAFKEAWDAKWTGQTRNRAKGATAGAGSAAGAPAAAAKPAKSLFA